MSTRLSAARVTMAMTGLVSRRDTKTTTLVCATIALNALIRALECQICRFTFGLSTRSARTSSVLCATRGSHKRAI
jgi:hypothetical protein